MQGQQKIKRITDRFFHKYKCFHSIVTQRYRPQKYNKPISPSFFYFTRKEKNSWSCNVRFSLLTW